MESPRTLLSSKSDIKGFIFFAIADDVIFIIPVTTILPRQCALLHGTFWGQWALPEGHTSKFLGHRPELDLLDAFQAALDA